MVTRQSGVLWGPSPVLTQAAATVCHDAWSTEDADALHLLSSEGDGITTTKIHGPGLPIHFSVDFIK